MRIVPLACLLAACSAAPERASRTTTSEPAVAPLTAPGLRLPESVAPIAYDLTLDIDPESELVRGEVNITARIVHATDHVWLHADGLDITAARWDRGALSRAQVAGEQMVAFRFGELLPAGTEVRLSLTYGAKANGDQEGLFRQREGAWYVFSQGEAVFARRFVPCFDEPRFKTPWRLTLTVPRRDVALSNMPAVETTVLPDGRHKQVVFAPTPPLPSYLVAIAVGPFDVVDAGTVGARHLPVRVAVRSGVARRTSIVASRLPAIVDAIEHYIGEPLPYTKLDLVGVPRFFGAMENPGLITFHEPILAGNPKYPPFVNYFTSIAAHELAHQWFGNEVTPAWWDHLWLSEAFASWLGDKIVRVVEAYDDAPLRFALSRREALEADRTREARPLRRTVTTTEQADEGFDSIGYAKGHLVLATFEHYVGEEPFRATVKSYVAAARGTSVPSEVFTRQLARDHGAPLAAALESFVTRTGAPVVDLALRCDAKAVLVATARDGAVPLCVRAGRGSQVARVCGLASTGATQLPLGDACPTWVHANPDGGYYHTHWTSQGPRGPAPPLVELPPAARIIAGDDLAAAVVRGELRASDALSELRVLAESRDVYAQLGAVALARAIDPLVDDASRPAWTRWLAARFADRVAHDLTRPGKPAETELAQALATTLEPDAFPPAIARRAHELLDKVVAHAQSELPAALVALAGAHAGDKLHASLVRHASGLHDTELRDAMLASLGELGPGLIDETLALVTSVSTKVPPRAAWPAMTRYLERGATRSAAWKAIRAQLPAILHQLPGAEGVDVIDAMAHLCDPSHRVEVEAAFAGHLATIPGGAGRLEAALASIDRCVTSRTRLGDVAAAVLATSPPATRKR